MSVAVCRVLRVFWQSVQNQAGLAPQLQVMLGEAMFDTVLLV